MLGREKFLQFLIPQQKRAFSLELSLSMLITGDNLTSL